ncbi:predicted protein [Histoplasma capsulatum H143]|uniref:Uncharacterized protein n=1 Tax=Ajellomyces capsulatus (strain H143) TaxID=544712 RepID=C6HEW7_AJECH|nr:predicted protein [Histoplasma capsulatum H143]
MLRTSTESTGDLDIITRKIVSTGDLVSYVEITNESDGQSFHLHFKVLAEFSWINIIVASAQFRGVVDIDGSSIQPGIRTTKRSLFRALVKKGFTIFREHRSDNQWPETQGD